MSRPVALLVVLVVVVVAWPSPSPSHTGVVTRVVDGDTIWVDGVDVSIRFLDVDAPELDTPEGIVARDELVIRLDGRVVDLFCDGYGYYGRWLCKVRLVD